MRKWRATWLGSRFSKSTLEDFTENKNPEVCPKTIAKTNIKRSKLAKKFEITKFKVRFFNHFIWPMVRDYKKITCPNLLKDRKLFKNLLIPCSFLPLNSFQSQSISIHLNSSQSISIHQPPSQPVDPLYSLNTLLLPPQSFSPQPFHTRGNVLLPRNT